MHFKQLLEKGLVFFDGGMGTLLAERGLPLGEVPDIFNITHPEVVKSILEAYKNAGAHILTTNTGNANAWKLKNTGYSVEQVIAQAVNVARQAAGSDRLVALDLISLGQLLEPSGTCTFDQAYELFAEQVRAGVKAGVDLILCETFSDVYEAKAAILAAKEHSALPVLCTFTFQKEGRTLTGSDPVTAALIAQGLGVDAVGVNCSLGPREVIPFVEQILSVVNIPVMVQPNAGIPSYVDGETVFALTPDEFVKHMCVLADKGVRIFGGCCGTTPVFIQKMVQALSKKKPTILHPNPEACSISSAYKTVWLGRDRDIKVIGERINPTGNKKLKEAFLAGRFDYAVTEAIRQKEAGADILDVNVGLPGLDEAKTMLRVTRDIQAVMDLPLCLDSANPEVLEQACRRYNGRPLINSVNGTQASLDTVLPLVKKYGACVIGLCMDEQGIPHTREDRVRVANKIKKAAEEKGLCPERILMDALVLTVSAKPLAARQTLETLDTLTKGVCAGTVLGISNVSFGLPRRDLLNRAYLAQACSHGLSLAIINPFDQESMHMVHAYREGHDLKDLVDPAAIRVLEGKDPGARDYIAYVSQASTTSAVQEIPASGSMHLEYIIISGLKDQAAACTKELLKTMPALSIVNEKIIPALDQVGARYEKKELFLPQLIQSAETVRQAFEIIKAQLAREGAKMDKGRIILATVKGDIHDIGKNIIKVILENYGYEVIDLGKDVAVEEIVQAVRQYKVSLVGLSALMTTTLKSMGETIHALKESGIPVFVVVGGAVLDENVARSLGADFYGRDVEDAIKVARQVFT